MIILAIIAAILIALLIVFGIGHALGPPVKSTKFDETPADVVVLDTSDGVPVDSRYDPLSHDDTGWVPIRRSDESR